MHRSRQRHLRSLVFVTVYAHLTSVATPGTSTFSEWALVETFRTISDVSQRNWPPPSNPFFANNSLLGRTVRCTDEEKVCLSLNRILFPADGKCYPLGDGPAHCRFAVDRCELERKQGHIRGTCAPTDLCRFDYHDMYRMAYDGSCVRPIYLEKVCGAGAVNVIQHFFGDSECSPVRETLMPELLYVPQPATPGECVFPNLRVDVTSVAVQESRILHRKCSQADATCFAENKVYCEDVRRCCDLLQKGHCERGEWIALNRTAWNGGKVEAGCVRRNACPAKARLMAFDRRCHNASEVLRLMCPGGVLLPNAFGEMSCVTRDFYKHYVQLGSRVLGDEASLCEITHTLSYDQNSPGVLLKTDCGLRFDEDCFNGYL